MELSSIDPKLWGHFFWNTIDFVIAAYPEKASEPLIQSTKTFFETWKVMLPCKDSRKHYAEFYDSNPIDFSSRNSLNLWISKLRNSKSSKVSKVVPKASGPTVSKVVSKPHNPIDPNPVNSRVVSKTPNPTVFKMTPGSDAKASIPIIHKEVPKVLEKTQTPRRNFILNKQPIYD